MAGRRGAVVDYLELRPALLGVFHRLTDEVGLQGKRNGQRPRVHDFRHGFAVRSVLDWYAADLDVGPRMAALSTYLGMANRRTPTCITPAA